MNTLSHRIRLDPTPAQVEYFKKACGTARFVYNWALAEWNRQYELGLKPTWMKLRKQFNAVKDEQFPWTREVTCDAVNEPFRNLGKAYNKFFKGVSERPSFKKKGRSSDSFYIQNVSVKCKGKSTRIPLLGWVKMRQELRLAGRILLATVSRTADHWYISITVEGDFSKQRTGDGKVGVDVGVKHAAILSTGEKISGPKPLRKKLRRLKIHQRRISRKQKGSTNRHKAKQAIARLHERIANIRKDFWHKLSTRLCRENQAIAVEDLNVQGMARNHRLARALSDAAFGTLRPMLEYKAKLYGTDFTVADRFYPSSKLCSKCGLINAELTLADREWTCECGVHHDRDVNAAQNLANLIG